MRLLVAVCLIACVALVHCKPPHSPLVEEVILEQDGGQGQGYVEGNHGLDENEQHKSRKTRTPDPNCPPPVCNSRGDLLAYGYDCRTFFDCSRGWPVLQLCPNRGVFEPTRKTCVTREVYPCKEVCENYGITR